MKQRSKVKSKNGENNNAFKIKFDGVMFKIADGCERSVMAGCLFSAH